MIAVFRFFAVMALGLTATIACINPHESQNSLHTDLALLGNLEVRNRFVEYTNKVQHCNAEGSGKRIMITGFGLFSGADYNISGLIVEALADPQLWPNRVELSSLTVPPLEVEGLGSRSRLRDDGKGARTWQRTLEINDKTVTICLVHIEVLWDFAGAIAIHEANLFQPDMVIMVGRGGFQAIIETGALNEAVAMSGFDGAGSPRTINTPFAAGHETPRILPLDEPGIGTEIAMTWDAEKLKAAAEPLLHQLPEGLASIRIAPGPRSSNNYICNNISFIVLNALKGNPVKLAGGTLVFDPRADEMTREGDGVTFPVSRSLVERQVAAGFFHLPYNVSDRPRDVLGWAKVVAGMATVD